MKVRAILISSCLLAGSCLFVACQNQAGHSALDEMIASKNTSKEQQRFTFVRNEAAQRIDVIINDRLFTSYCYPDSLEKSILFPIYSAKGTVVTRGFPVAPRPHELVDHPHQVGLWFTFGDVNGLDFWNNSYAIAPADKYKYGQIRHRRFVRQEILENEAILEIEADWLKPNNNVILKENTCYTFGGDSLLRYVVRQTKLTASHEDVLFQDNKEGMFAIRVAREFEAPNNEALLRVDSAGNIAKTPSVNNVGVNGVFRNSRGLKGYHEVWGTQAEWVCLTATKNATPTTLAIFDHPENPGFPGCYHARYYGLFSVDNFGRTSFNQDTTDFSLTLKQGESITFYHQFTVADKALNDKELNDLYARFVSQTAP